MATISPTQLSPQYHSPSLSRSVTYSPINRLPVHAVISLFNGSPNEKTSITIPSPRKNRGESLEDDLRIFKKNIGSYYKDIETKQPSEIEQFLKKTLQQLTYLKEENESINHAIQQRKAAEKLDELRKSTLISSESELAIRTVQIREKSLNLTYASKIVVNQKAIKKLFEKIESVIAKIEDHLARLTLWSSLEKLEAEISSEKDRTFVRLKVHQHAVVQIEAQVKEYPAFPTFSPDGDSDEEFILLDEDADFELIEELPERLTNLSLNHKLESIKATLRKFVQFVHYQERQALSHTLFPIIVDLGNVANILNSVATGEAEAYYLNLIQRTEGKIQEYEKALKDLSPEQRKLDIAFELDTSIAKARSYVLCLEARRLTEKLQALTQSMSSSPISKSDSDRMREKKKHVNGIEKNLTQITDAIRKRINELNAPVKEALSSVVQAQKNELELLHKYMKDLNLASVNFTLRSTDDQMT